ncbi:pilus assembly protein TadG-related protein [Terrabacter sp. NPDC080008]|uniref:pilus assembly protein TadG-related protein n=1 Tax=Terrabacter sp. NPDC080008 TaxID=3155176 RepID=UPI00344EA0E7
MRRLIDPAGRTAEKGAAAVIVAILFSTGAVMGCLAVSVDLGNLMSERRQLQNGADAASLALALSCAKGDAAVCDPGGSVAAIQPYADKNAKDSHSAVTKVCARNVGAFNAAADQCPDGDATKLTACPPLPAGFSDKAPYVEVTTETRDKTGVGTKVLTPFGQALVGSDGTTVKACARAAWGGPGSNEGSVPLVLGRCNWDKATSATPPYAPAPPYSPGPNDKSPSAFPSSVASYVVPIFGNLNGSEANSAFISKFGCAGDLQNPPPSGGYTAGGFGWVDTVSSTDCTANVVDGTVVANTGALPSACKKGELASYVGREVLIPVISSVSGSGTNAKYTVDGVSSFYFAGYRNVSAAKPSDYNVYSGGPCDGYKSECIWGWFTSPLLPAGSVTGGGTTSRGPITVGPVG